ncbi:2-oxoglutarate translocator [Asaccharospora irregularis]|nr:2-oxoglutarate translocator [Asaccharospora irregularis]
MRNQSQVLLGVLCVASGIALILSIVLPNWIWSSLIALLLIGCGVLLFL